MASMHEVIYCLTPKAPPCNRSVQSSHRVKKLYHRVYFCYRKECFQIKFVSKTKEFTSQSLPGRGKDNIPSSALRKLLIQLLGGVKTTESLPDASTERCQMPSYHSAVRAQERELSTTHPTSCRKFILSPLIQKHFRPLIYAAPNYLLSGFFPWAKKELVPLLSDGCLWVRAEEPLAWSWYSAADRQNNPATEDFPHPAATWTPAHPTAAAVLSHMPMEASCSQGKIPASAHGRRKVSQPWGCAKCGDDYVYTSSKGDRDDRWKKCTPFSRRFSIPFKLSSQKGANCPCPVISNLSTRLYG